MKLYFPFQIERMKNKDIRSEYSRLRSVANKRLQRLQEAGLGRRGDFRYPKIAEFETDYDIAVELANVSRWLWDPRTTVRGERKFVENELEMLREKKITFVNRENFYDFLEFMDYERAEVTAQLYDSDIAAEVYNEGQRLNIPEDVLKEHYEYFAQNIKAMEQVKPIKTEKTIKFWDIKRKMKRLL